MLGRNWRVVASITAIVILVAGCSSSSGDSSSGTTTTIKGPGAGKRFDDETGNDHVVVKAVDNNFTSQFITVKKGATVTFQNDGRNRHDVVPDKDGSIPAVSTDQFDPGYSSQVTFSKPGVYGYYCSLHGTPTKGMYGVVKVVG